jgi:CRISPR-associated protein Cas2
MHKEFVVVSYDVPDDRRRQKLAQVLLDHGSRVQYSVFECLLTAKQWEGLRKRIEKIVDKEQDRVRFYHLCEACVGRIELLGEGKIEEDVTVYII